MIAGWCHLWELKVLPECCCSPVGLSSVFCPSPSSWTWQCSWTDDFGLSALSVCLGCKNSSQQAWNLFCASGKSQLNTKSQRSANWTYLVLAVHDIQQSCLTSRCCDVPVSGNKALLNTCLWQQADLGGSLYGCLQVNKGSLDAQAARGSRQAGLFKFHEVDCWLPSWKLVNSVWAQPCLIHAYLSCGWSLRAVCESFWVLHHCASPFSNDSLFPAEQRGECWASRKAELAIWSSAANCLPSESSQLLEPQSCRMDLPRLFLENWVHF